MLNRVLLYAFSTLCLSAQAPLFRVLNNGPAASGGPIVTTPQTFNSDNTGTTFTTFSTSMAPVNGHTVAAWVKIGGHGVAITTITSVTDGTNTYSSGSLSTIGGGIQMSGQWWYATSISGSPTTIVAHFSGPTGYVQIMPFDISNVTARDIDAIITPAGGTNTATSATFTPGFAKEAFLCGIGIDGSGGAATFSAGAIGSLTPGAPAADSNGISAVENAISSSTLAANSTATINWSTFNWNVGAAISFH